MKKYGSLKQSMKRAQKKYEILKSSIKNMFWQGPDGQSGTMFKIIGF